MSISGIVATTQATVLHGQAPAVATGDSRTVSEPSFPATCQRLTASFHDTNEDVPLSVEQASTNLDQARIQSALTACSGTGQAVQLSMDGSGNNSFLSGPLSIPAGVTLLVDPGVTLYFSRNAQDYDNVTGQHLCGTVSANSNTGSCKPLIAINNANGAGIMGYGKLNGRGGDVVLNSFPTAGYQGTTTGKTWWDLAADANSLSGNQQNPRGIQITSSNNVTFYKFTFKNSPNFHIAINRADSLTIWGIHIVTPYNARNTDGIDPGNATNTTIRENWVSDGDDNIAVGANAAPSANISVIHNKFFAGHGESIGSLTTYGVNNVLFDDNAMYGDADVDGGNSTGIRIKSANDRGGLVQNIQYSNSCFVNHGTQIQLTPLYNTNAGTNTPSYQNILFQNLRFANTGAVATGSFTFLGASNNGTVNKTTATLDNVTIDTVAAGNLIAPANATLTFGPGQVSSNFVSLLTPYNGTNGNTITDARTSPALAPPACNFTFLAPSLTGPAGTSQTVTNGQYPTAAVILQPAVAAASYPYPTGTVTLTDEAARSFQAKLPGTGDTIFIPITNAPAGTHTYTASYSGNAVYPAIASFGSYTVTVAAGNLGATTTALSNVPATLVYGNSVTATATLTGSNPTGSISFLINGAIAATVPVSGNTASYTFAPATGTYSVSAVYGGDATNSGSSSTATTLTVTPAATAVSLVSSSTTATVGTPVNLTATVASTAGTPTGTVTFTYTTTTSATPVAIGTSALSNAVATYAASLPQGTDSLTATYNGAANFSGSASSPAVVVTVAAAPPVPASAAPIALPYTVSTIVGGAPTANNATCTGHVDTFGDGCQGTSIGITGTGTALDLRSVTADPFGNVYFTDANAALVRKVSFAGIVTQFAGYISGTACVPTATVGCTPTLVRLSSKPRGIYSDPAGNVYIAGYNDNKVHYVRVSDGKMYLLAGNGTANTNSTDPAGDGGSAVSANLKGARGVATDAAGNIYIADSGNNRIREVLNPYSGLPGAGNIQTVAGNGTNSSTGDGALATSGTLSNPQGVAVDTSANIYIAEGSRVRVVCVTCTSGSGLYALLQKAGVTTPANGNIYTLAGTGSSSNPTLTGGLANTVNMAPQKLVLDPDGNLYIADSTNNAVWFIDGRTAITRLLAGGGTATSCSGSAIGDGCVGTQAIVGSNGGNGMGVGLDLQGNLYVSDSTNGRIRKVSTNLRFGTGAVGATITQPVVLHSQPGDTFTAVTLSSPDFTLTQGTCTTNADTTQDCAYTATFKAAVAGNRAAPLTVTTTQGNNGQFTMAGFGTGAGATLDPARQVSFGENLAPNSIAVDAAGNVLVADATTGAVLRYAPAAFSSGTAAAGTNLGSFTNPSAVTTDGLGNVFVADIATGLVSRIPANGTTTALNRSFTTPRALATDVLNNVYVLDSGAKTITEFGVNGIAARTLVTGLTAPTSFAVDAAGNLFVGDSGTIYKYDAQTFARTTVSTQSAAPAALAIDPAGNILVADSGQGAINAFPASANSAGFSLIQGVAGNVLALDGAGNAYTTSANNQIVQLLRTQGVATYNGTGSTPSIFNLLSIGNAPANLTYTDPDTTNFTLTANSATDCTTGTGLLTVAVGGACQLTSSFTPVDRRNYSNTVTFGGNAANPALATPSTLTLTQVGNNAPFPVAVTLNPVSPASPSVGSTITLSATVTSTYGTPTGAVTFSVDGAAGAPIALSGGAASTTVSSPGAGSHALSATYTSADGTFAAGSATPVSFTVAKLTPTVLLQVQNTAPAYGAANTATVTVSGTQGAPTGTLQFTVDGANSGSPITIVSGSATYALPVLAGGNHSIAATYSGDANYNQLTSTSVSVTITPAVSSAAVTLTTNAPGYGQTNTAAINVASTAGVPSGTVQFTIDGTNSGTPVPLSAGRATYTLPSLSAGTHTIGAVYSGDTNFATATASAATETVSKAAPTVTFPTPAAITYGTPLSGTQLRATASVPGTFTYTPALGTVFNAAPTAQTLSVTFAPTDATNYSTVTQTTTILVNKQASTTALALSATTLNPGQPEILTATVTAASSGTPSGLVSFQDGATVLGMAAVTAGKATLTTTALISGNRTLTANYLGDTNFSTSSGSSTGTVTVAALDFSIAAPATATVTRGTATTITYQLTPTYGTYPGTVSFVVAGLPPTTALTLSPVTVAANAGNATVTLTIPTKDLHAENLHRFRMGTIVAALLLLPLAGSRRMRLHGSRLGRLSVLALLCLSGAVMTIGLTGCGDSSTNGTPATYTVTVTATSGTVSHSSATTLTVN